MKLPSGREVGVKSPTYGQILELRKRGLVSDLDYQRSALDMLAVARTEDELDRLDLVALVQEVNALVAGRLGEQEERFREHLAAALGGNPISGSETMPQLIAYRWCELLGWPYSDVVETPIDLLPLCLKFRWTRQQLLDTPAQAVRDFLTIHNYEKEIAEQKNGTR